MYTKDVDIDPELKQSLEQLLDLCRELGVRPRLIGGLAVRGFARRKRFTHDIDLVISRHDKPNLIAILKRMGFDYQDLTQFEGVKATRHAGDTAIEIHISIERLWDMASKQTYTLSSDSAEMPIDDAGSLLAPTVSAEGTVTPKGGTMKAQIACPNCRSTMLIPVNGNLIDTPLICQDCGQWFTPNFYCPDARSTSRHIFAATGLHVDNAGALYAFCPIHTFTTYTLAADSKPRPKRTPLLSLVHFFDILVFRLTLAI